MIFCNQENPVILFGRYYFAKGFYRVMTKIAGFLVVESHYFSYFFIMEFLVKFEINDFFLPVGELLHGSNHSCSFFFTFLLADEQRFMAEFESCFLMNGCKCKTGFFLECPE